MKSPVVIVAITLTAAILVAASLLIFTGMRKSSGTSTLSAPACSSASGTCIWSKIIRKLCAAAKRALSVPREFALQQSNDQSVLRPFLFQEERDRPMRFGWRAISGPVLTAAIALLAILLDRYVPVPSPAPLFVCIVALAGALSGFASAHDQRGPRGDRRGAVLSRPSCPPYAAADWCGSACSL